MSKCVWGTEAAASIWSGDDGREVVVLQVGDETGPLVAMAMDEVIFDALLEVLFLAAEDVGWLPSRSG